MNSNMINILFDKSVKSQRLEEESGSDIETYENYLSGISCTIQPLEDSYTEKEDGQFSKNFLMFCDVYDILDGDKIIDGNTIYKVVGVEVLRVLNHSHMEITITENA